MTIKRILTLLLFASALGELEFPISCYAQQRIGIGTPTPDASAVLDVASINKGLLLPRLSAAQRDAIASPAAGLFIYNTSANKLEYWNGSGWMQLSNSAVAANNLAGNNPGQSVAVSATASRADPSALLDIQSSTGGLLIPRMSAVQRDAIVTPIAGLLVYNMNTNTLNFYTSAGWAEVCRTQVSTVTGAVTTPGNAGINTATPDPSAMLDITSVTAGLAIPRMTTTQRDAILSPAQGLMLFNTTTQSINVYNGTSDWLDFISMTTIAAPMAGTQNSFQTQIVWNWNTVSGAIGYKWNTTNDYSTAMDMLTALSKTDTGLTCNTTYTRYVWAYNCSGNSAVTILTQTTSACGSFVCGGTLTVTHTIGSVAPETKTVNYGTVTSSLSGASKCWITQNLGADNQATSANDSTDAAAGWYWQFNRKQGHRPSPLTPAWDSVFIVENSDWLAANDPCTLLLGAGWRVPTYTEWNNANITGGWANSGSAGTYASVLKIHDAGFFMPLTATTDTLLFRGSYGFYWSGTQSSGSLSSALVFDDVSGIVVFNSKASIMPLRCLKD